MGLGGELWGSWGSRGHLQGDNGCSGGLAVVLIPPNPAVDPHPHNGERPRIGAALPESSERHSGGGLGGHGDNLGRGVGRGAGEVPWRVRGRPPHKLSPSLQYGRTPSDWAQPL